MQIAIISLLFAVAVCAVFALPSHEQVQLSALNSLQRPVRYDDYVLLRVQAPDAETMAAFARMELDVWARTPDHVDMFVSSRQLQSIQEQFASELTMEIVDRDIQNRIDEETVRLSSPNVAEKGWFEEYHRYEAIKEWYQKLAQEFPHLIKFVPSIGKTHEGRDLFAVHLTAYNSSSSSPAKKQIWFQSQIHAREWISGATIQYFVHRMLHGYGKDEEVTVRLNLVEYIIVPIVNPDGYEYTWKFDRLWRKNRRNNGAGRGAGVDLNRNYDSHWDEEGGASRSPMSEVYKGPSPASEPEVQAVTKYFLHFPDIIAGIDFHSYSQLVLRPMGNTRRRARHEEQLKAAGDEISEVIRGVHGKRYKSISSVDLYPTTGTALDWFYDEEVASKFGHHVYGYTLELRPDKGLGGSGFVLPPREIIPTGEEIFAAMLAFTKTVLDHPLD